MKNRLIETYPLHYTQKKGCSGIPEKLEINLDILEEACGQFLISSPKLQQPPSQSTHSFTSNDHSSIFNCHFNQQYH